MTPPSSLTGTATLARSTLWNLAGRLLPLLVAIAATPLLIDSLGLARWGIFAIALSLVGLFGMFDLGIGRALTRLVAARLATPEHAGAEQSHTTAAAVATGLALLAALGLLAGLAAAGGAWAYADLLDLPAALRAEVRWALLALSAAAPLVLVNAALWGVLAAHQRFAGANLANLPILALYYLGPLAALAAWDHLAAATIVLVACRVAMTWAYWRLCRAAMPALATARPDWSVALPLLRQGGWITVSNALQPLAQHLDRFIIAARLSAEAAAHYATPFDVIIRIAVLAQAVLAGAFPAIAAALAGTPNEGGADEAGRVVRHSLLAILGLVLPPCLVCLLFADLLLAWWLGPGFAAAATAPARWLAAGIVLFALDGVAAALIDGAGHARRNALLAVAELALYLPCLFLALDTLGIAGAAMVWTLRAIAVAAARLALATGIHAPLATELRALAPALAATMAALAAALALTLADPVLRLAGLPFLALAPALLAWRHALTPAERTTFATRLAPRRRPR